jgi:serine/threonine protein phosphatase PrpC
MLKIHAKSDVGLVRSNNEDFFFTDPVNRLIIVADGAGGHDYGEIASRLAVESCYQYLTREDYLQDTTNIPQTLMDSIIFANQQVIEYKHKHTAGSNMGTTLSCVHVGADKASYAWMGDSRIYLVDRKCRGHIRLSTDHTLYQEMLDRGELGQNFNRHILSRMLGNNPHTRPDADSTYVTGGNIVLVCSDGFSNMVSEDTIVNVLADHDENLDAALEKLVEFARGQGGRDNITVAFAEVV